MSSKVRKSAARPAARAQKNKPLRKALHLVAHLTPLERLFKATEGVDTSQFIPWPLAPGQAECDAAAPEPLES